MKVLDAINQQVGSEIPTLRLVWDSFCVEAI